MSFREKLPSADSGLLKDFYGCNNSHKSVMSKRPITGCKHAYGLM